MVVGHLLTELHSILWRINPALASIPLPNVFFDKSFSLSTPISLEWYLKQLFDTLLVVIILANACISQKKPSFNIFCIFGIYLLYGIFDILSFTYNYKHGDIKYWVLLVVSAIGVYLVLYPLKKPKGKIIRL